MRLFHVIFLLIFINPVAQAEVECDPPIPPEHGTVNIFEDEYSAGSRVEYICDEGRILVGSASSICLDSGEWTSQPPTCAASCNTEDLVESQGIVPGDKMVLNGELLNVRCREGYSPNGKQARCSGGKWNVTGKLCQESSCTIPKIDNGFLSHKMQKREGNNVTGYTYRDEYHRLILHEKRSPGSSLYIYCYKRYTFQGERNQIALITCSKGQWDPDPVCLIPSCNTEDLVESQGIVPGDKMVLNGKLLNVTCREGYSPNGKQARCFRGKWNVTGKLCQETGTPYKSEVSVSLDTAEKENIGTTRDSLTNPCFAPKIDHGKIGRYMRLNNRTNFQEVPVNSKIEDDEELYLRCERNYEPFGKPIDEIKVTCYDGKWDEDPVCEPAMCRGPPPPTLHGNLTRANRTHGGSVVYHCRQYAKKMKAGNITCVFGTWKGDTAVCKDLRCYVKDLVFPGLVTGRKTVYNTGEVFSVNCEPGYNLIKGNYQLKCEDGEWKGQLPPCLAVFCNPEDLVESQGIVPGDKMVLNGQRLNVRCREGYSPSGRPARCSRGRFIVTGKLCLESSCTVPKIDNGFLSLKTQEESENWSLREGFIYRDVYHQLRLGGETASGVSVYLYCNERYTFQGERNRVALVRCSKGQWVPDPVCLISEPGCSFPKTEHSKMIIEPTKDVYRFGESVSLSCNPGYHLSSDVVRVMCLETSWSESVMPECVKNQRTVIS